MQSLFGRQRKQVMLQGFTCLEDNDQSLHQKLGGSVRQPPQKMKAQVVPTQQLDESTPLLNEKPLSADERRQDEIEEAFIARTRESAARQSRPKVSLPLGNHSVADLQSAVRRGVKENSTLLQDWSVPSAKLIGNMVKVYWDGDKAWYYGRIVNYDTHHKRHFIYYMEDSTVEWIDLNSETVVVGQEIVIATRQLKWPALRFWVSESAKLELRKMRGYAKNSEYIEFFSENGGLKDWAFVPADSLVTIAEKHLFADKRSNRLDKALAAAVDEQVQIDSIVDTLACLVRRSAPSVLVGPEWVGVRVRSLRSKPYYPLSSNSSVQESASSCSSSKSSSRITSTAKDYGSLATTYMSVTDTNIKATGKIVQFCPSIGEHLLVFDQTHLQPQWVVCSTETVDALVSMHTEPGTQQLSHSPEIFNAVDAGYDTESGPAKSLNPEMINLTQVEETVCMMCGRSEDFAGPPPEGATPPVWLQPGLSSTVQHSLAKDCDGLSSRNGKKGIHTAVKSISGASKDCFRGTVEKSASLDVSTMQHQPKERIDGVTLSSEEACAKFQQNVAHWYDDMRDKRGFKTCRLCHGVVHKYCMPMEKIGLVESQDNFICWKCLLCEGGCGANAWTKPQHVWQLRRVDCQAPDRTLGLCGDCVFRFKHKREYCPICYKLYAPDDTNEVDADNEEEEEEDEEDEEEVVEMRQEGEGNENEVIRRGKVDDASDVKSADSRSGDEEFLLSASSFRDIPVTEHVDSTQQHLSASLLSPTSGNSKLARLHTYDIDSMVQCNECSRWVHSSCEGIDQSQHEAMTSGTHPVWGDEYLCPLCRVKISENVISAISVCDVTAIFQRPVDVAIARTYYDVIRTPMDLATMRGKAARGQYKSLQTLRQDFELMCLNALTFNKMGDDYWKESRIFHENGLLVFSGLVRHTQPSAFGVELQDILQMHDKTEQIRQHQVGVVGDPKQLLLRHKERSKNDTVDSKYLGADTKIPGVSTITSGNREVCSNDESDSCHTNVVRYNSGASVPGEVTVFLQHNMVQSGANVDLELLDSIAYDNTKRTRGLISEQPTTKQLTLVGNAFLGSDSGEISLIKPELSIALPTVLTPAALDTPLSYYSSKLVVQGTDEAFYLSCMDHCLLCASAANPHLMLFCFECGEAMHSFCSDVPLSTLGSNQRHRWRCMNCKVCEVCGVPSDDDDKCLVHCGLCDQAYHMYCLAPTMDVEISSARENWFCPSCVICEVEGCAGLPSWGFAVNYCCRCLLSCRSGIQLEIQRMQHEDEQSRLWINEDKRASLELVSMCQICGLDTSTSYLLCSQCNCVVHMDCNAAGWADVQVKIPAMLSLNAFADLLCLPCSTELSPKSREEVQRENHVGSALAAVTLVSRVATIQRNRMALRDSHSATVSSELENHYRGYLSRHRIVLNTIIRLACSRLVHLEEGNFGSQFLSRLNASHERRSDHIRKNDFHLRSRACRFVQLWQHTDSGDGVGSGALSGLQQRRALLCQGMASDNTELTPEALAKICSLAASFLAYSTKELNDSAILTELPTAVSKALNTETRFAPVGNGKVDAETSGEFNVVHPISELDDRVRREMNRVLRELFPPNQIMCVVMPPEHRPDDSPLLCLATTLTRYVFLKAIESPLGLSEAMLPTASSSSSQTSTCDPPDVGLRFGVFSSQSRIEPKMDSWWFPGGRLRLPLTRRIKHGGAPDSFMLWKSETVDRVEAVQNESSQQTCSSELDSGYSDACIDRGSTASAESGMEMAGSMAAYKHKNSFTANNSYTSFDTIRADIPRPSFVPEMFLRKELSKFNSCNPILTSAVRRLRDGLDDYSTEKMHRDELYKRFKAAFFANSSVTTTATVTASSRKEAQLTRRGEEDNSYYGIFQFVQTRRSETFKHHNFGKYPPQRGVYPLRAEELAELVAAIHPKEPEPELCAHYYSRSCFFFEDYLLRDLVSRIFPSFGYKGTTKLGEVLLVYYDCYMEDCLSLAHKYNNHPELFSPHSSGMGSFFGACLRFLWFAFPQVQAQQDKLSILRLFRYARHVGMRVSSDKAAILGPHQDGELGFIELQLQQDSALTRQYIGDERQDLSKSAMLGKRKELRNSNLEVEPKHSSDMTNDGIPISSARTTEKINPTKKAKLKLRKDETMVNDQDQDRNEAADVAGIEEQMGEQEAGSVTSRTFATLESTLYTQSPALLPVNPSDQDSIACFKADLAQLMTSLRTDALSLLALKKRIKDKDIAARLRESYELRPWLSLRGLPPRCEDGIRQSLAAAARCQGVDSTTTCLSPPISPAHVGGWGGENKKSLFGFSIPWEDPRVCCFCQDWREDAVSGGFLTWSDGGSCHSNCLRWSSEVVECNHVLKHAYAARKRIGTGASCSLCGKRGATVGCVSKVCKKTYHVRCALAAHCSLLETQVCDNTEPGTAGISSVESQSVKSDERYSVAVCSEHVFYVDQTRLYRKWEPANPERLLLIEADASINPEISFDALATRLEEGGRRFGQSASARTGALTILSLGTPRIDMAGFHTRSLIFPHHFTSARLFWSMHRPGQRTLYVFEVLCESDFEGSSVDVTTIGSFTRLLAEADLQLDQGKTPQSPLEQPASRPSDWSTMSSKCTSFVSDPSPHASAEIERGTYKSGLPLSQHPIFRVVALDCLPSEDERDPCVESVGMIGSKAATRDNSKGIYRGSGGPKSVSMPHECPWLHLPYLQEHGRGPVLVGVRRSGELLTRDLDEAYSIIAHHAKRCNISSISVSRRPLSPSYGLNAPQFFGLALPLVRRAIENRTETTAAVIAVPPAPQYLPSYILPSVVDAMRIQQAQVSSRVPHRSSASGAARTEGFDAKMKPVAGATLSRRLTLASDVEYMQGHGYGLGQDKSSLQQEEDFNGDNSSSLREENRRLLEANSSRYLDHSRAYRRDPGARLEVRRSHIHNWGLFTRTSFAKGDILIEYIGEKVRQAVADRREAHYEKEGVGSCYLFRLDNCEIVDATRTGGMARFMNHCCEPNAVAKVIHCDNEGRDKHIVIIAARDIQKGEEITYDYKFPLEEKKLRCYCGATRCKGSMN